MNTRLQVEHPVTEAVTGLDLVEWQFRVAAGEPLPRGQDEITLDGHAVEARLYAENPTTGFLPSTGPLEHFRLPTGVRIDAGVAAGGRVTPFYDPMIAKLIAHGETRAIAIARLRAACEAVEVWSVRTNAGFLGRCLADPDFVAGDVDTGLIERGLARLAQPPEPSTDALAAAADALRQATTPSGPTPWSAITGFRLNGAPETTTTLYLEAQPLTAPLAAGAPRSVRREGRDSVVVFEGGEAFLLRDHPPVRHGEVAGDGHIRAPMPGRVTLLAVRAGDRVAKGQALAALEAMKMEHTLSAPFDGVVAETPVEAGAQVSEGTLLVRLEPEKAP
jgi:acetyl/propionyl-CoA carboxylase alpha subunit